MKGLGQEGIFIEHLLMQVYVGFILYKNVLLELPL